MIQKATVNNQNKNKLQRSGRTSGDTQEFTIGQVPKNPMQQSTVNNTLGVAGPDTFDNPYSSGQQQQ